MICEVIITVQIYRLGNVSCADVGDSCFLFRKTSDSLPSCRALFIFQYNWSNGTLLSYKKSEWFLATCNTKPQFGTSLDVFS